MKKINIFIENEKVPIGFFKEDSDAREGLRIVLARGENAIITE